MVGRQPTSKFRRSFSPIQGECKRPSPGVASFPPRRTLEEAPPTVALLRQRNAREARLAESVLGPVPPLTTHKDPACQHTLLERTSPDCSRRSHRGSTAMWTAKAIPRVLRIRASNGVPAGSVLPGTVGRHFQRGMVRASARRATGQTRPGWPTPALCFCPARASSLRRETPTTGLSRSRCHLADAPRGSKGCACRNGSARQPEQPACRRTRG